MRRNRARGFGNLIGRGVGGQIRLDGEQFGSLALLTRGRGQHFLRLTVAIDAGDPDARRQQAPRHALPMPPAAPVTIATRWFRSWHLSLPL
jgi:hypothetical protein